MKLLLSPTVEHQINGLVKAPGGTVLLHGPHGVGRRTTALEIARRLNCEGCEDASCRSCVMAAAGNHPDIVAIRPDEKNKIGIEAVHKLQQELRYAQYEARGHRVVIMVNAHLLTIPAANALLKILEEPPQGTTIILTATAQAALLETIVSRCRPIYLSPQSKAKVKEHLLRNLNKDPAIVEAAANLSDGSVGLAMSYAQNAELLEQRMVIESSVLELAEAPTLFDRLRAAAKLSQLDNLPLCIDTLTTWFRRSARETSAVWGLEAVENLRRRLQANVSPKIAFEALAVEVDRC